MDVRDFYPRTQSQTEGTWIRRESMVEGETLVDGSCGVSLKLSDLDQKNMFDLDALITQLEDLGAKRTSADDEELYRAWQVQAERDAWSTEEP